MNWPFHNEENDGLEQSDLSDFWKGLLAGIALTLGAVIWVWLGSIGG
jgi:hypothetical protein